MRSPKFDLVIMVNGKSEATFAAYCSAMAYAALLQEANPEHRVTVFDTKRQAFLPAWSPERVAFEKANGRNSSIVTD